jgi:hypothetical protein
MAQFFTPLSSRCFPVGGRDLSGNLTIFVVEGSQNNYRASESCYIAKCTFLECFFSFALAWPDSNRVQ